MAREGSKAAEALVEAVPSEEANRPSARRPNHHPSVVPAVAAEWAAGWEDSRLVVSENRLADLASRAAVALAVVVD